MQTMYKYVSLAAAALFALVALTGVALATDGGPAATDWLTAELSELAKAIYTGFRDGEVTEAAMLTVILAVAIARRWGEKLWKPLGSGNAAVIYTFVGTVAASLAAAGVSTETVREAIKLAAAASGGYAAVRQVVRWALERWPGMPKWPRKALMLVLWALDNRSAEKIAKAEKAGDDAVAANPPTGLGKPPTKIP